jgi:hypothetical protein
MFRLWFSCLIFCVAFQCFPLMAQKATVREPSDLKVELRSETGSTQFQIGEVIPLEVLLSSTTPNRYLEPCAMFRESNFGHPQCRFFTQWSIDILPADGADRFDEILGSAEKRRSQLRDSQPRPWHRTRQVQLHPQQQVPASCSPANQSPSQPSRPPLPISVH